MWGTSVIITLASVVSLDAAPHQPESVPHFTGIRRLLGCLAQFGWKAGVLVLSSIVANYRGTAASQMFYVRPCMALLGTSRKSALHKFKRPGRASLTDQCIARRTLSRLHFSGIHLVDRHQMRPTGNFIETGDADRD